MRLRTHSELILQISLVSVSFGGSSHFLFIDDTHMVIRLVINPFSTFTLARYAIPIVFPGFSALNRLLHDSLGRRTRFDSTFVPPDSFSTELHGLLRLPDGCIFVTCLPTAHDLVGHCSTASGWCEVHLFC